jgi:rhodanese-related sulfurtransferase
MSELATRVEELAAHKDKPIIVHCHHGGRSLRVAKWLREQGFIQAQSMAGGIDAWSLQIDPDVPRY